MAQREPGPRGRASLHLKPLEAAVLIPAAIAAGIMISNPIREIVLSHHVGNGPLNPFEHFLAYNFGNLPFGIIGAYGVDFLIRNAADDVGARTKSPTRLLLAASTAAFFNVATETFMPTGFGTTSDFNDIWAGFAGIGIYAGSTYLAHKSEYSSPARR